MKKREVRVVGVYALENYEIMIDHWILRIEKDVVEDVWEKRDHVLLNWT